MLENASVSTLSLTPSDRAGAALAHLSGIPLPLLGPLAAYIVGSRSKFIQYHALHALIGMFLLNVCLFTLGAISIGFSLVNLWQQYQEGFRDFQWWPVILKSVVTWIVFALIGIINTIVNIWQAVRAYQGHLPGRSLTTAIVNRFLQRPALEPVPAPTS